MSEKRAEQIARKIVWDTAYQNPVGSSAWFGEIYEKCRDEIRTALLDRVKDCRELMEEVKRYRDIFAEITAKAAPLTYSEGDPERITSYSVPVGPIHRAAGKTGFQMFNGEEHLLAAVKEAREANERAKQAESSLAEAVRALEDVVARVACTDDDDYRSDLEDRLAAIGETCVAALSSLQPRMDTP